MRVIARVWLVLLSIIMLSACTIPGRPITKPEIFSEEDIVRAPSTDSIPEGADPEHCPFGLNCFHDFETGLAYAKKVNKPIMLDFTGWGCVNCRKMEELVWSDHRILDILQNELVLISLYVDDRTALPPLEQFTSEITGMRVQTIGNKWSNFQVEHFQANSQPYYVIIGHDKMEPINGVYNYSPDVKAYFIWLKEGIWQFEKEQ